MKKKILIASLLFLAYTTIQASNVLVGIERTEWISQKQDSTLYILYKKADSLYKIKNYSRALEVAYKVLDKAISEEDSKIISQTHYLIGKVWYKSQFYKRSINSFKLSLKGFEKLITDDNTIKDVSEIHALNRNYRYLNNHYRLGVSYQRLFEQIISKEQNDNYVLSDKDSIMRSRFRDSIIHHYNRTLESGSLEKKIMKLKSNVHNNMAGIYYRDGLYKEAEESTLKSLEIQELLGDVLSLASGYNALSNIYFNKGQYEDSKEVLFKGIESLDKIKDERVDRLKASLYKNVAFSMYMLKDYRAYSYQEKSWHLFDKINDVDNERVLVGIEADRNYEKGKQEGVFQEELRRQRAERNIWILGIGLVSVIVLLGFLLSQFKLKQKNLRLALSQKEAEAQMEILSANLSGQEAERKRISQELHDGVLSRLFGSRMGLGYLELDSDKETQSQYQKYLEELQSIEKEIREVSHQLSSDISLSETSFLNAINQLLKEKSELGNFDFQLKMDDSFSWKELEGVLEMNLFRILQESLQNILKHAQAKNVFVSFKVEKQSLLLEIKDDGVGYETKKKTKGIGLKNIKSRVKTIKGTLNVSSESGNGTSIELKIPLN